MKRLGLVWDGEFDVDHLHAPNLRSVDIYGGEWTTEWLPMCVREIRVRDATITPDDDFEVNVTSHSLYLHRGAIKNRYGHSITGLQQLI